MNYFKEIWLSVHQRLNVIIRHSTVIILRYRTSYTSYVRYWCYLFCWGNACHLFLIIYLFYVIYYLYILWIFINFFYCLLCRKFSLVLCALQVNWTYSMTRIRLPTYFVKNFEHRDSTKYNLIIILIIKRMIKLQKRKRIIQSLKEGKKREGDYLRSDHVTTQNNRIQLYAIMLSRSTE